MNEFIVIQEEYIKQMYLQISKLKSKNEIIKFIDEQLKGNKTIILEIIKKFEDELKDVILEQENDKEWSELKNEIELKIQILSEYLEPTEEIDTRINIEAEKPIKIIWAKKPNGTSYVYDELKGRDNEIRRENYSKFWILLKRFIDNRKYEFTKEDILTEFNNMYKIRPNSNNRQERFYAYKIDDIVFIIGAYNKKVNSNKEWRSWLRKREKEVQAQYEELQEKLKNPEEKAKILEEETKTFEKIEDLIKPKKKDNKQNQNIIEEVNINEEPKIDIQEGLQIPNSKTSIVDNSGQKDIKTIKTNDNYWNQIFAIIKNIYETHGHSIIPLQYKFNGQNIGKWLSEQKKEYKAGRLTKEQIEKLESIEIIWDARTKTGKLKKEEIMKQKGIKEIKLVNGEVITTYIDGTTKTTEQIEHFPEIINIERNTDIHNEINEQLYQTQEKKEIEEPQVEEKKDEEDIEILTLKGKQLSTPEVPKEEYSAHQEPQAEEKKGEEDIEILTLKGKQLSTPEVPKEEFSTHQEPQLFEENVISDEIVNTEENQSTVEKDIVDKIINKDITNEQEERKIQNKVTTNNLLEQISDKVDEIAEKNQRKIQLIEQAETLLEMLHEVREEEKKLDKKINEIMNQMHKELGENYAQR